MFYHEERSRSNKRLILVIIVVVLIVAIAAVVLLNYDKLKYYVEHGEFPSGEATMAVSPTPEPTATPEPLPPIVETENTIGTRFTPPEGFERVSVEDGSFAEYLRNFTLKNYGAVAKLADGSDNTNAPTVGIFDQDIRKNGLQQCADAIIRLYAEYRYARGEYDMISFNFNNTPTFTCDYSTWLTGQRVRVTGNKAEWYQSDDATPDDTSYATFRYYIDMVQLYANTDSLKAQMNKVSPDDLQIGDSFIITAKETGATDGHAIIVVDMCVNKETGEKRFICAEGNTPATETYILTDPNNDDSVWFSFNEDKTFTKDKYTYPVDSIRRF